MQAVIVAGLAIVVATAHADPAPHTSRAGPRVADVAFVAPQPRPPAPVPHPYPETATAGKALAGTYACTGAVDKVTIKLALDSAWIQWTIVGTAGTTVQYRTYDGVAKQWTMLELTSSGKSRTLMSLGADAKANDLWTWTLDDHRELETFTPKDGKLVLTGERRRGTTWAKHYDATCQRAKH